MAEKVEVYVEIHADTPDAILIDDEIWIPRSQIDEDSELDPWTCAKGDSGNILLPEWLAQNEGLI